MHILSPETDNCPSRISEKERMTTEYFMINLTERMLPTRQGSNPQPPDHQLDTHQTEPLSYKKVNSQLPSNPQHNSVVEHSVKGQKLTHLTFWSLAQGMKSTYCCKSLANGKARSKNVWNPRSSVERDSIMDRQMYGWTAMITISLGCSFQNIGVNKNRAPISDNQNWQSNVKGLKSQAER